MEDIREFLVQVTENQLSAYSLDLCRVYGYPY